MPVDFAGVLHVYVLRIEGFKDQAGFNDKADPFVEIKLGNETFKTPTKNNAGGNVIFDNFKMSFNKQKNENMLKIRVMDQDTLVNDTMGTRDIDLNIQDYGKDKKEVCFELTLNGKTAGNLYLDFEMGKNA